MSVNVIVGWCKLVWLRCCTSVPSLPIPSSCTPEGEASSSSTTRYYSHTHIHTFSHTLTLPLLSISSLSQSLPTLYLHLICTVTRVSAFPLPSVSHLLRIASCYHYNACTHRLCARSAQARSTSVLNTCLTHSYTHPRFCLAHGDIRIQSLSCSLPLSLSIHYTLYRPLSYPCHLHLSPMPLPLCPPDHTPTATTSRDPPPQI